MIAIKYKCVCCGKEFDTEELMLAHIDMEVIKEAQEAENESKTISNMVVENKY